MRALLDVNVLISLLDPDHVHHDRSLDWMEQNQDSGWATCPITVLGCLRIMGNPKYSGRQPISQLASLLRAMTFSEHHVFWADKFSPIDQDVFDWERLIGHQQLTDLYLLALAAANGGRLVSLDSRIQLDLVPEAGPETYCPI